MKETRNEKLQKIQDSMGPLVIALNDYLSDTERSPEGRERSQIEQDASSLYSNLKGFLGNLQIQRILDQEQNLDSD